MTTYEYIRPLFSSLKEKIAAQPEDEREFYSPWVECVRVVLEQPAIPTEFMNFFDTFIHDCLRKLDKPFPPAKVSKMINSLPRMQDHDY